MKLFLAGTYSRPWLFEDEMPLYVLESFFYFQDWQKVLLKSCKMFLLDSGAFTFMSNVRDSKKVNFDEYLNKYINFIKDNDIKYFFELDIDSVVGYEKVKQMRNTLEKETGKKCIPVWHKSRGIKEWYNLCEEYSYVAIGGIVSKEITKKDYTVLKELNKIAAKYNTKVHGLGFTNKEAYKYGFFSVDSTNWLSPSRFGGVAHFDGTKMIVIKAPKGKKCVHYKIRDKHTFSEWIKYQKYLDNN